MDQDKIRREVRHGTALLKQALPEADRMMLGDGELARVAAHCLKVRSQVPWGDRIPEGLFRSFVLIPRVNDEDPVFYHDVFWRELEPRLKGCSMTEAALEINFWCFEKAVYRSTDDRTANPLTVIRRGFGRCGEESVLLVSALRACGIPARQVYVPRWSHCDDNHAWVEVWADGKWHYMGACEPEPVLDSGWFTSAASKAMLVHTRAYGDRPEGEIIAGREGRAWILNRTPAYADTSLLTVRVTENGAPREGLEVRFEVLNGAEFYPIHTARTDKDGWAALDVGRGSVFLHAHDGERYSEQAVTVTDRPAFAAIRFEKAVLWDAGAVSVRQDPPGETRIQGEERDEGVLSAYQKRMRASEEKRLAHERTLVPSEGVPAAARGNGSVLRRFLADGRFAREDREALLGTLREKDLADATQAMLEDALLTAIPHKGRFPPEVWKESVLCPRVADEKLYPDREWLRDRGPDAADGRTVWEWVRSVHTIRELFPPTLIPRMRALFDQRECSGRMLDILFAALCRSKGIPARLDPVTGEKQVWENGRYTSVLPEGEPDAALVLRGAAGPVFGVDLSVAHLSGGTYHTLRMQGRKTGEETVVPVFSGQYRVICCTRQIDGSMDARLLPAAVRPGERREVMLSFPEKRMEDMILKVPLGPLKVLWEGRIQELPKKGAPALIALLAPGEEPTVHFLDELLDAAEEICERGINVQLLVKEREDGEDEQLRTVLRKLKKARLFYGPDRDALREWRKRLKAGELRLPLAAAVDAQGRGRFAFTNYHVGSVRALVRILTYGDGQRS